MNYGKGSAQGFALFTSGAHARAACDQLQHVRCAPGVVVVAVVAVVVVAVVVMAPGVYWEQTRTRDGAKGGGKAGMRRALAWCSAGTGSGPNCLGCGGAK